MFLCRSWRATRGLETDRRDSGLLRIIAGMVVCGEGPKDVQNEMDDGI